MRSTSCCSLADLYLGSKFKFETAFREVTSLPAYAILSCSSFKTDLAVIGETSVTLLLCGELPLSFWTPAFFIPGVCATDLLYYMLFFCITAWLLLWMLSCRFL